MSLAKITLLGMMEFQSNLFDKMELPAMIDKETLINNILLAGGEFEVIYTNPYFLTEAIGNWSRKNKRTFDKWIEAVNVDFSPIENYDRYEDITDHTNNESNLHYGLKNVLEDATATTTTGSTKDENKTSAYDSSTYQPNNENTMTYNNLKNTNSGSRTSTNSGKDSSDGFTHVKHEAHIHGNIGVTESTTMAEHFIDFYKKSNIYEMITDLFLNEFTIIIY